MRISIKSCLMFMIALLFLGCAKQDNYLADDIQGSPVPTGIAIFETEAPDIESESTPYIEPTEETPPLLDTVPGAYQLRLDSKNGEEYMDYFLFIPDNAVENMPLIVFLHGSVEIGHVELLENYGIVSVVKSLYGDDFPFLLLLPCTHKPSWTTTGVPEVLIELIDEITGTYHVDPSRISITGHSLGSVGTWKMVSLYSDYFSAAVPISCGIDEYINYENCAKVPIIAYAGTVGNDEINYNPAMHKLVDLINAQNGRAQMRVIEGADHEAMVTAAYTIELFDWMLSQ